MKIWVNTIVHNEENFIWFSLMSVVDFVDKILVWDTGSTDETAKIIEEVKRIKGDKIEFRQVGETSPEQFTLMRQKMLEESKCDWILILDGDEVWWEESIKSLVNKINKDGDVVDGIVVPMIVPVGDIYHLQEDSAGEYCLLDRKGHFSLRAINRKITGLHVNLPYGQEGFYDTNNLPVQERKKILFLKAPYLHTTHLKRSTQKRKYNKVKYELGQSISGEYKFPEVFYKEYPSFIRSPWVKMSGMEYVKASILTPLRKIKRSIYG